jgi:L-fucose isomerase
MSDARPAIPKIGLIPVLDPRIDPELEQQLLAPLALESKLQDLGIEVLSPGKGISREEEAVAEAERMRVEGACGIVFYTVWFLRANVIVGAARHAQLPVMVWSIPSLENASLIGFGVTHGSLDEAGIEHEVICDAWGEAAQRRMLAWARACHVKKLAAKARYGHIGGKCLSMMTADGDANQWRRMFGIDVDHAEQWTLIHEAEKIPASDVELLVQEWKRDFRSIDVTDDVLSRSAKLYIAGKDLLRRNRWDFAGVKCQFELLDNYLAPCLPIAMWNDEGTVVACETDMNAALTMFALQRMSGEPVMFADIQYLNREEGWARFLNCGTAAPSLAGGAAHVALKNCPEVQGTYDEETGKHLCKGGACPHFVLPPGPVTLARLGRIAGRYVLHLTSGASFAHPHDESSMLGIGGVWPFAYVQIEQEMEHFVNNLRAHHMCIAFGDWVAELEILARLWGVEVL